jgi:hypothetical protein
MSLRGQDLLSVLADPVATSIDDTPIPRHWFVRNRWHEEFELRLQQVCLGEYSGRCQFVIGADVPADSVSRRMRRIDWLPKKQPVVANGR